MARGKLEVLEEGQAILNGIDGGFRSGQVGETLDYVSDRNQVTEMHQHSPTVGRGTTYPHKTVATS